MSILALHGVGTSAAILQNQLAPLIAELGSRYDFVFVDGAVSAAKHPVLSSSDAGPFYSYTTGYTPTEIREAFDDLTDIIAEHGPFDGVIGFSQGASMAIGYILEQQRTKPGTAPPFGFAVLLSSVAAFSPCESYNQALIDGILDQQQNNSGTLHSTEKILRDYLFLTFEAAQKIGSIPRDMGIDFLKYGKQEMVPRIMHPTLTQNRVQIPTVHASGKKDLPAMREQSRQVQGLCDGHIMKILQHSGGHGPPSRKDEVRELARAIEWAMEESQGKKLVSYAMLGVGVPSSRKNRL